MLFFEIKSKTNYFDFFIAAKCSSQCFDFKSRYNLMAHANCVRPYVDLEMSRIFLCRRVVVLLTVLHNISYGS